MKHNARPLQALIVENDAIGRELLARVLRLHGCDADTAIGAHAARGLLADPYRRYDLLVTDLRMEPLDGLELLRDVAAMEPALRPRRVVVLSGFVEDYSAKLAELQIEQLEVFQKPIHLPTLVKLLDKLKAAV